MGTLYLIPTPLDFGCEGQSELADLRQLLPASTIAHAAGITHWVVENAKSARAFLKRVHAVQALACSLQEMQIAELPRAAHKKGDHGQAGDAAAAQALLAPLLTGQNMGLLSEAGMPAVADPGSSIVRAAHAAGARVLPLVGPSSILLALAASGLNGQQFAFVGYLPQNAAERATRIKQLEGVALKSGQAQLCIETPYRNAALWQALLATLQPATMLALHSGLTLDAGFSCSLPVAAWRKLAKMPEVEAALQLPCIFAWGQ
jgi:16S rRNA (cytidine1402-2'-O)-methyltransferase